MQNCFKAERQFRLKTRKLPDVYILETAWLLVTRPLDEPDKETNRRALMEQ
jgi:hypothetical protein